MLYFLIGNIRYYFIGLAKVWTEFESCYLFCQYDECETKKNIKEKKIMLIFMESLLISEKNYLSFLKEWNLEKSKANNPPEKKKIFEIKNRKKIRYWFRKFSNIFQAINKKKLINKKVT